MQRLMILDPTFEVGYPIDSDLSQMADDGCPLVAARLPDLLEERYILPSIPPWLANTRYQRLREELELRGRWWAVCERMVQRPDTKIQLESSAM
jgi:hypothetical protein